MIAFQGSQPAQPQQLFQQPGGMDIQGNTHDHHSSKVMVSNHMDYIHHISFDVYGRRMATCSGDRFVRVWDLTDTGDWNLVGEWQAHRGNVTKIAWAHPEFGSVLATSGSDSDAKIWEERTHGAHHSHPYFVLSGTNAGATSPAANLTGIGASGGGITTTATAATGATNTTASSALASRWTVKTQLTEARKAVTCLEFAPRHWGLKLATGSADGCVRIYEAVDVMNLSQWPLAATLQAYGQGEGTSSALATDQLGVSCLSWCTGRFEPPTLVVGGSHLSIFRYMESARSWQPLLQLPSSGNNLHVLDVAWAPNVGRRFHYIAAAEDQQLRVYKLSRTYADSDEKTSSGGNNKTTKKPTGINNNKLEVESAQTLMANAWRCQWNVTGTVLASSGDAGAVQMWKADNNGDFQCVAQVQGDLSQAASGMVE
ncbi:Nucleoporin SEH1 [Seminavis robusta]|uniref:Nucleoporin SEH1 n=1 Tax=Seminavis robusta TaxID=568900 RepID=A0A9N8EB26_9STRA|nr:Nucleoporin SEH1 [Seminavis robusta]|eukprot:Sro909_g218970.1 Nucleoporin SEH1 (428) ;mRNA; f:17261-18710